MATRRTTNQAYKTQENERNAQAMATGCTTNQAYRTQEKERNAHAMATRRTDLAYKIPEQNADTNWRRLTRQTNPPEIRAQENERNAQKMKGMLKLWRNDVLI